MFQVVQSAQVVQLVLENHSVLAVLGNQSLRWILGLQALQMRQARLHKNSTYKHAAARGLSPIGETI